jgi:hypothetical protein
MGGSTMTNETLSPARPSVADAHAHPNQFALLRQRRFAPFFWTQFGGAANDNLFLCWVNSFTALGVSEWSAA